MKRLGFTTAVAILFALSALSGDSAFAQSTAEQQNELKAQIERRFDVVPLRGSVLLKPKDERGYRSIDLTDAAIAIDGATATGPELRDKLGDDADLVLRLSYLEPEARRRLFQPTVEAPPGVASTLRTRRVSWMRPLWITYMCLPGSPSRNRTVPAG